MKTKALAKANSRPKGGNEPRLQKEQNRFRQLRTIQDPAKIHQAIIEYQFEKVFQPSWFGTILWQPFITDFTTAVKEARHFRNKFYCALLNTSLKKISRASQRPRMIMFHEKKLVHVNPQEPSSPRYKIVYHTHFHLEQCPSPYGSCIHLDWLIRRRVAHKFRRFSTINSAENKGFVLLPWEKNRHANYTLKDFYRFKYQQDADLVLDIQNSDMAFDSD